MSGLYNLVRIRRFARALQRGRLFSYGCNRAFGRAFLRGRRRRAWWL